LVFKGLTIKADFTDKYLIISLILTFTNFLIYFLKLDNPIGIGNFVTHHLAELPGYFFFGIWLRRLFQMNEINSTTALIYQFALFFGWVIISSLGNVGKMGAAIQYHALKFLDFSCIIFILNIKRDFSFVRGNERLRASTQL